MKNGSYLICSLCLALFHARPAQALALASADEANSADQARVSLSHRLESEASTRDDSRTRAARQEKAVLALKAIQRREEAKVAEAERPAASFEHTAVLGVLAGLPLMLGYILLLATRYAMRLRAREHLAMLGTFQPGPGRIDTPTKPRPKVPLAKFLAVRKQQSGEFSLSGEMTVPSKENAFARIPESPAFLAHPQEKYGFKKLLEDLPAISAAGWALATPASCGFVPRPTKEKLDFNKLLAELPVLAAFGIVQTPSMGSGEFKTPVPKPKSSRLLSGMVNVTVVPPEAAVDGGGNRA